ncbi:MAG: hypothetical protein OEO79_09365 [Gemmatimonadota bacterium]|nr:hypothetical protein [Gemmatimonadota bacterium]MDH3422531.1 hypothetical protein [Gemmatimonadota bacterium]
MTRACTTAALAAVALGLAAPPLSAQSAGPFTVGLSADTVAMGELFELRVNVPVPPGSVVYFPDTLPATVNVESAEPVRLASEPAPDGGAKLTLSYPIMAFGTGTLPVPGFDVLITPRGDRTEGTVLPGGSVRGAWDEAPPRSGPALTRVPRQAVWVVPVFTPQDLVRGIEPRPPNDVVGGDWNWPSLALVLLFSSVLAVTLASTTKEWLTHARGGGHAHEDPTLEALRQRALRQLDDLRVEGLLTQERLLEFYTRSSGIVRTYVEAMEREWAPSLTSSELMGRLRSRSGDEAAGSLPERLGLAEVVKFGRLRPGAEAAEEQWRSLKSWVEESGGHTW